MRVILGYDPREALPYAVAEHSIRKHASQQVSVERLDLASLVRLGYYTRPTDRRDGRLWDVLSADRDEPRGRPMATEHACARFFTPAVCGFDGWALFADCDILVRDDIATLFALANDRYAVMVVKHRQESGAVAKMDGQIQTFYARKNWSSVCLWNCGHPANRVLRFGLTNRWPGRDLHAFAWLQDEEIGELPQEWNFLVGVSKRRYDPRWAYFPDGDPSREPLPVRLAHFTLGTPDMPGWEHQEYADEWRLTASEVTVR